MFRSLYGFSLCLVLLAGILVYAHHQLSQLSNSLAATADKETLDALLKRLGKVDERLDTLAGNHLVTNEDFRAEQQDLSNRIGAAQAYAKQATESAQEISQNAASAGELVALKASVETLDSHLQELSQSRIKQTTAVPFKPKPKPVARQPKRPTPPATTTVTPPPPFTVSVSSIAAVNDFCP